MDSFQDWLNIAYLAMGVGTGLYLWLTRGSAANRAEIEKVSKRVDDISEKDAKQDDRLTALERDVKHIDQNLTLVRTDTGKTLDKLDKLNASVEGVAARLQEVAEVNKMLIKDLMGRANKKDGESK